MFFSEARLLIKDRRLIEDPNNYTYENAHDQVQAIRLLHYKIGDDKVLCNLIKKCHTFDEAYSYLKNELKAVSY